MKQRSLLLSIVMASCVWLGGVVPAANASQIEEEVKRFDYEIEWKTIKAVQEILTPKDYAHQIHYDFPVFPPARRAEEVKALIRAEVERVLEEKYPESHFDEIDQEAQQRYRLYKVGDQVTIGARLRGTEYEDHTGVLRMITVDHIKLGDLLISLEDVQPRDRSHFDRFLREDAIKQYVSINKRRYRELRTSFESDQRALITNAMYQQNGYRLVKSQWWPSKVVFDKLYQREFDKLMTQKRPDIRRQVLETNGIVLDDQGNPVQPAGTTTEVVGPPKTPMEKATPVLKDIVRAMFGKGDTSSEGDGTKPLNEEGKSLFEGLDGGNGTAPPPAPPKTAPAPPAPKAAPADVSDLYDERDE